MLNYKLEWDPSTSSDAVSQSVRIEQYDGDGNLIGEENHPVADMATNFLDVALTEGRTITWFVTTTDDAGNTSASDPTSFEATDTIPPAPATNLRFTLVSES